jgi:DNA segregation ATPase FtsK/SpoIIIE, S-DNA-T family
MSKKKKSKHRKPSGRKTALREKQAPEPEPHAHHKTTEIAGFLTLTSALILFLSLFSFAYGHRSDNWLGIIGYTTGWIFHSSLGITSYLVCIFVAWIGWQKLFERKIKHLNIRIIYFVVQIVSAGILLSLTEEEYPSFGRSLSEFFYPPPARYAIPYYLGGLPLHYLYAELPSANLRHVFNSVGVMIIFTSTFFASLLFFFNIPLSDALRWIASRFRRWKVAEVEVVEDQESDFMRFVKLRIPSLQQSWSQEAVESESPPRRQPSFSRNHELLQIEPQRDFKNRPPPPDKKVIDPAIAPTFCRDEGTPSHNPSPKLSKREAALSAQSVWNGDFKKFKLPGANLITPPQKFDQTSLKNDLKRQAEVLEETLLSFGLEAKVGQINCGPTITSFEVHPAIGVKVQKIKALENDIALNMEAASIRIIAPIPGKAAVGVEVPNPYPQEVSFREMLHAYQRQPKKHKIPLLLGKSVSGDYVMSDLAKMPHLIIAGATGSGKSVCINTIVMSIVYTAKPDEIQLLMIDPKKVELTPYSQLPHMIAPVITNPQESYTAMQWLVKEMEKRYEILNKLHLRNIDAFNSRTPDHEKEAELNIEIPEKFTYIVGIVDELADLMMVSSHDIETPIARIAQMARAVGIHLILATQRPSREVITGLIKANFPTRICFKVSSGINSKIILDSTGGEQLLGNGDMLFLPPGTANLSRVQGAFIRDQDILSVIKHITSQAPPNYRIPSFQNISSQEGLDLFDPPSNERDALYEQALDVVLSTGNASTTFLQRKLKIGYARAASLMDQLEAGGVVGPPDGSKARQILAASKDRGEKT